MSENLLNRFNYSGRLRWFHWLVLGLSIALTIFASVFAKGQHDQRIREEFKREAYQTADILKERMNSYADSLWAGVAFFNAQGARVSLEDWQAFARGLNLEEKYPGINGIGVIYHLTEKQLPAFLKKQRKQRPSFKLRPKIKDGDYWPITYIVPAKGNEEAIGLDISYEANRLKAAIASMLSKEARMTGPISLVQDDNKTPGFLFYAPIYDQAGEFIGPYLRPLCRFKTALWSSFAEDKRPRFFLKRRRERSL